MTHSLHRKAAKDLLKQDFVVLITPAVGINHADSKDKLIKILDKILDLRPNNIGSYETGTIYSGATIDEIKRQLSETPRVRCCFDDKQKVRQLLEYLVDNNFGLSVTVSGLIDEIIEMTNEMSINAHSVNLSLGVFGKTEDLPSQEIVELISLCGHGMISRQYAEDLVSRTRQGSVSCADAARELAKPCVCGIFNTTMASAMIERIVGKK